MKWNFVTEGKRLGVKGVGVLRLCYRGRSVVPNLLSESVRRPFIRKGWNAVEKE